MNKKVTRILATLLSLVMLLTLVAACGADETTAPAGTTTTAASDDNDTDETTEADETEPVDEDRELVTLSAFIMQSVASTFGLADDWMAEIWKDELGIQIEFMPTGDAVDQKLLALMASGELPDIVGFKETQPAINAVEAGMLLSLDEHADKLPNVFENDFLKHARNYYRDQVSAGQNELFMMPSAIGPVGASNNTNWKPQLLWRVYQDIGAPEIGTLEDYLDVVEQMQAAYPENEAGEKVYGFSIFSDWDNLNALQISTLSFFYGIDTEYVSQLMEVHVTDHDMNSILDENSFYKRALQFYFDANQRGLLDPDSLTQTFDQVQEKYSAGRTLFSHFSWLTGTFNSRGSGNVDNDPPNGYELVIADDFKIYDAPYQSVGRPWTFALSASTRYPDRALEFFNWFYDPINTSLLSNGPEGIIWEYDENGEPYVTDEGYNLMDNQLEMPLPGGGTLNDAGMRWNTMPFSALAENPEHGYAMANRNWPRSLARNPTKLQEEWRAISGHDTMIAYLVANDQVSPATQAINMVPTAPDDLQMVMNQIGDVVKTNSWQMVMSNSQAEFDALWADMVEKADILGIDQVNEYYEGAWAEALGMVSQYED